MIEDLPDISEIENNQSRQSYNQNYNGIIPSNMNDKVSGKLRNNYLPPEASGMGGQMSAIRSNPNFRGPEVSFESNIIDPQPRDYFNYMSGSGSGSGSFNHNNCVDVSEHTLNCIVCSKLYNNNNTLYILVIIFLAIVNLLLLKRILETDK